MTEMTIDFDSINKKAVKLLTICDGADFEKNSDVIKNNIQFLPNLKVLIYGDDIMSDDLKHCDFIVNDTFYANILFVPLDLRKNLSVTKYRFYLTTDDFTFLKTSCIPCLNSLPNHLEELTISIYCDDFFDMSEINFPPSLTKLNIYALNIRVLFVTKPLLKLPYGCKFRFEILEYEQMLFMR